MQCDRLEFIITKYATDHISFLQRISQSVTGERYNLLNFVTCSSIKGNSNPMNTLDQVLETALQLSYEQQEMLIKILQNRHHETRRAEMAADALRTLADFHAGKFRNQSAEDVVVALRQSLYEPDA